MFFLVVCFRRPPPLEVIPDLSDEDSCDGVVFVLSSTIVVLLEVASFISK